jgi:hypothetical protein
LQESPTATANLEGISAHWIVSLLICSDSLCKNITHILKIIVGEAPRRIGRRMAPRAPGRPVRRSTCRHRYAASVSNPSRRAYSAIDTPDPCHPRQCASHIVLIVARCSCVSMPSSFG